MLRSGWLTVGVSLACCAVMLSALPCWADGPEVHPLKASELEVRLEKQIRQITSFGSRVPGYEGHELTADLIIAEFRKLGLANITVDEFTLSMPIDQGARLSSPELSESIRLYPFWPNSVRCVTTGPEGLTGKLIYVGQGDYPDYNRQEVMGSIVLMDFESQSNYLKARDLGAKAILFVAPEPSSNYQAKQKVLSVPLNIPRLYVPAEAIGQLKSLAAGSKEVTIHSRMDWKNVTCRNIYAEQTGRDAQLPAEEQKHRDERILISSYYDSISVVPSLAPGAEQSSGLAALLETARHFGKYRPLRTVGYLLVTGHAELNAGMHDFMIRHCAAEHYSYHAAGLKNPPVPQEADFRPRLAFALDLTSHSRSLVSLYQAATWRSVTAESPRRQQMLSLYGKDVLKDYFKQLCGEDDWQLFYKNGISPEQGKSVHSHVPIALPLDGNVGISYGHRFISLVSGHDSRTRVDTPFDRADLMDFGALAGQVRNLVGMLEMAVNDPELIKKGETPATVPTTEIRQKRGWTVHTVRSKIGKGAVASDSLAGALVAMQNVEPPQMVGQRSVQIGLTDEQGNYSFTFGGGTREAYKLDPADGGIIYAADLGSEGAGTYPLTTAISKAVVVLFRCQSLDLIGAVEPNRLRSLDKLSIFDSYNSSLQKYSFTLPSTVTLDYYAEVPPVATVFVPQGQQVKIAQGRGFWGYQYLLLGSEDGLALGKGLDVSDSGTVYYGDLKCAQDMSAVNRWRQKTLMDYGIQNALISTLLDKGQRSLERAEQALKERDYGQYAGSVRVARGFESAAYPLLKDAANDTVKGVIFYFALLIPFSFFCERLFFGFVDIKKQLAGTAGIFVVVFVGLRMVHPAFKISDSPYLIFMAFIILSLGLGLLVIIVSKFNAQMAQLRRASAGVHHTDVGRLSATVVAILLGISNMRKRKLRTFLTTTTVVLLMFTVVSFMSVDTYTSYFPIPVEGQASYKGLMFRDRQWTDLKQPFREYVGSAFTEGTWARRCWFYMEREYPLFQPVRHGQVEATASGIVGMDPTEPTVSGFGSKLLAGRWLSGANNGYEVVISSETAQTLGITREQVDEVSSAQVQGREVSGEQLDKVTVNTMGHDFMVVGIIDKQLVLDYRDIDGEKITPLAHATEQRQSKGDTLAEEIRNLRSTTLRTYNHVPGKTVMFMNYDRLLQFGGRCKSLATRPAEGADMAALKKEVKDFLSRTTVLIFDSYMDDSGRSYAYSAIGATKVSGLLGLIVPMLIAGSIVVNAIMGSVHERTGEIEVYSSVGLAPVHISALFIAESTVYAVLGAILGYLLGQAVAWASLTFGILQGINLNYSSLAVVLGSVLVMAVVLLAALYPSRLAARLSVPDVTRRWQFPKPQGDIWKFDFPFTVSERQVMSLFAFLNHYFQSYKDVSVGAFYTRDVSLSQETGKQGSAVVLAMNVWLRPFDLGISQQVMMKALPTADEGISHIEVEITRMSGEHAAWQRFNGHFMREIRKQFLIYRTIPEEQKQAYAEQGRALLSGQAVAEAV